jgi:hypothetical protein
MMTKGLVVHSLVWLAITDLYILLSKKATGIECITDSEVWDFIHSFDGVENYPASLSPMAAVTSFAPSI